MTATLLPPIHHVPALSALARCPFHDGVATLDLLLAELDAGDTALFDAALDLRTLCAAGSDAAACVHQLFRVRALLDERHYLAFYRVRCWARRHLWIEVRASRGSAWLKYELPLNGARLDEVINAAIATLATRNGTVPASAHVRFVLAPPAAGE